MLSWTPKITFKALAKMMTEADWQLAKEEQVLAEQRKKENSPT
jgi:hypothetical protein